LVIFRGQKVLRVKKFDYTKHPEAKKIRFCNARDHIPDWRKEELKNEKHPKTHHGKDSSDLKSRPLQTETLTGTSDVLKRTTKNTPKRYPLPKAQPIHRPHKPSSSTTEQLLLPQHTTSSVLSEESSSPGPFSPDKTVFEVITLDDLLADM